MEKVSFHGDDSHPGYHKQKKKTKKGNPVSHQGRDMAYKRRSRKSRAEIDRNNEIKFDQNNLAEIQQYQANMMIETPTDSLVMPALKNKAKNYLKKKTTEPNANYQDLVVEESSFAHDRANKFDNQRFFDPRLSSSNQLGMMNSINQMRIDLADQDEQDWEVKTTSKGFLYFKLKGTND